MYFPNLNTFRPKGVYHHVSSISILHFIRLYKLLNMRHARSRKNSCSDASPLVVSQRKILDSCPVSASSFLELQSPKPKILTLSLKLEATMVVADVIINCEVVYWMRKKLQWSASTRQ